MQGLCGTLMVLSKNEDIKNDILSKFAGDIGFPTSVWGKIYKRELFENYGEYFFKIHFFSKQVLLFSICE